MIARISGKVIEQSGNSVLLDIGGISYEVFLPQAVMQRLQDNLADDGRISLITYHYYQLEQSKGTPVLIGFLNEIEKNFFEVFITVSGIGPRAAMRALNQPISRIARAIDEGDTVFLKSLPGIGEQRAREIVAKLQNKVGKFGLIQDDSTSVQIKESKGVTDDALEVLMQLQYKKPEAASMIKKALEISPGAQTTEEILNTVYKHIKVKVR